MFPYPGVDRFDTNISQPDDTDLILPSAATLNPASTSLANRTTWLKNRVGANRVTGLYGNAIGSLGYASVWSDTNPLTATDPTFAELASTENLIAFGSPVPLASADTLLVRCDVTVTIASIGAGTVLGVALGMSLSGGAFVTMPMSERYMVPLQLAGPGLIPNTIPMSLSAIVVGAVASSFNFCLMGSIVGSSPSMRVQLRGAGVITALHLTGN